MENQKQSQGIIRSLKNNIGTKKIIQPMIGIGIGCLGGFLYYRFFGCTSGHCPITGNPLISTAWGGMIGFLFTFNSSEKERKK